ncbi:MAG TPA: FRG domain-containing protein [Thermoflexales bacterium]|nr:FRG domain-containing protein [Thermoflexales bacterium]HQW34777.1 FRG domain-containing protein [Thermoflexales bacterium]HQZ23320.1 FRG domain-containing protein [Thermoflexales bacterium]HRA01323.1 FRG domain-containing protein [Thermoflexales bacterium]
MATQTSDYLTRNQIRVIETWSDFQRLVTGPKYRRWAFRGQSKSEWSLNSSLSRYFIDYKIHQKSWPHQEDRIIRIFRRKAQLFLEHVPDQDDTLQWLALIQHHGGVTRLLDFTWSPFVAAFFALEKAKTDCAVWAVNMAVLRNIEYVFPSEKSQKKVPHPGNLANFKNFFMGNAVPFVTPEEPYQMSQRQIAQSGTFLVPGVLDTPIEGIISQTREPHKALVKFVLKTDKIREKAMESLYYMNITNATLFPGLDGLARSLAYELEFHWAFNPKTMEEYPDHRYFQTEGS